jgi:hypothetical protein
MRRTDTITIDTRAGNDDICAAVRITRWLPGVVWSDLIQFRTGKFTVKYEDQIITGTDIILTLQKRGYRCVVTAAFPLPQLYELHHPLIGPYKQFMTSYKCYCQTKLLPCLIYGV